MNWTAGLLVVLLIPVFSPPPDYAFRLAWESPLPLSVADYEDLNGDGLSEILCITSDEEMKHFTLVLLDAFSHPLWEVQLEGFPSSSQFEDFEGDGTKEILLALQLPSPEGICLRKWKLTSLDAEGCTLWTLNEDFDDVPHLTVADINNDGYSEIMAANLVLDKNGNILSDFGEFSVTKCIQEESSVLLLLKEEIHQSVEANYTDHYKIIAPDGKIMWEMRFSQPTYVSVCEVEQEKKLFLLQMHSVSEVDLTTFEEKPRIRFDFDSIGDSVNQHFYALDLNGDGEQEYLMKINDFDAFGNTGIYVFDSQFHLIWKYTDSEFFLGVFDMEHDGKCEFVIVYYFNVGADIPQPTYIRVLNTDKSVRWSIFYKSTSIFPMVGDFDADGDTEIGVNLSLEEDEEQYLCIFGPDGTVEKQLRFPQKGVPFYRDLDNDGDIDILWCLYGKGIHAYANTRVKGPLDAVAGEERLEEVNISEKRIEKDPWVSPGLYYGWKRFVYSIRTFSVPSLYAVKVITLFSLLLVVGVSLFLERRRKMRRNVQLQNKMEKK